MLNPQDALPTGTNVSDWGGKEFWVRWEGIEIKRSDESGAMVNLFTEHSQVWMLGSSIPLV